MILNDKDKSIEKLHLTIKSKTEKENEIKKKLNDLQRSAKANEKLANKKLNKLESELMEAHRTIDNCNEEIAVLVKRNSILSKDNEEYIKEIEILKLTINQLSDELKKKAAVTIQIDPIKPKPQVDGDTWGIDDPWGIIENEPSY